MDEKKEMRKEMKDKEKEKERIIRDDVIAKILNKITLITIISTLHVTEKRKVDEGVTEDGLSFVGEHDHVFLRIRRKGEKGEKKKDGAPRKRKNKRNKRIENAGRNREREEEGERRPSFPR